MKKILFILLFYLLSFHCYASGSRGPIALDNRCSINVTSSHPTINITGHKIGDVVGTLDITYYLTCTVTGVIDSYYRYFEVKTNNNGLYAGKINQMYFSNNKNYILKLISPTLSSTNKSAVINSAGYFPYISWFNIFHLFYSDTITNRFKIILNSPPLIINNFNNDKPTSVIAIAATTSSSGYVNLSDFNDLDDQTNNGNNLLGNGNLPNIIINVINKKPRIPTCNIKPINVNFKNVSALDIKNASSKSESANLLIECKNTETQTLIFKKRSIDNIGGDIIQGNQNGKLSNIGFKIWWNYLSNDIKDNKFKFNHEYNIPTHFSTTINVKPLLLNTHTKIKSGLVSASINMVVNYD
ncbi:hypothetical protein VXS03_03580 [Photobacterium sp. S4TG1]|uniref:hypothetical protein n=1 Tax=Photobacterium sp. S4TG1 TaxID=3114587 RepID=UPI002E18F999|nr:hypothetical protein [Photobacterium sp. S4TG1]